MPKKKTTKKNKNSSKKKKTSKKKTTKSKKKTTKKRTKPKKKRGRPKKVFDEEKINRILSKGKNRGFVTGREILRIFPNIEDDIEGTEDLYEKLEDEGVEVKFRRGLLEDEPKSKSKDILPKIDSVQMYLKEIGKISMKKKKRKKSLQEK